jgi:hypothetical protein
MRVLHGWWVFAGVLGLAVAPQLAGQGARATRRLSRAPVIPVAATRVESARSVLRQLVGAWRFEIRFVGNIDGPPDASGTRTLTPLFDGLSIEWTETLDDSPIQGRGLIAFDPRSGQFTSTAVYSAGAGAELLVGILEPGEPLITFRPIATIAGAGVNAAQPQASALSLLDADHFVWAALDRNWRALFTRSAATSATP